MLSVVIPSFNEEENIENTANTVSGILENAGIGYELIFIDDGSKDATYKKICAAAANNACVRGAKFSRNFGKEASVFAGLSLAKGDCCVVMDCDLQHPPEVIPQMYRLWEEGYEVVEGVKADRGQESFFYRMSAGLFYKIISKFTKVDMNATSDFKLLDKKVVSELVALPEKNTFFRGLSFWVGFKSTKVEFTVAQRALGQSKWSFKSLLKYAVGSITSFTSAPLQFVTILGGIFLVSAVVLGLQTFIRFCMGRSMEGFTSVILLILLTGGAIMISLGIIGHYIARIYDEIKGRPQFIISETTEEKPKKPEN